jgi:hypothetical protein
MLVRSSFSGKDLPNANPVISMTQSVRLSVD